MQKRLSEWQKVFNQTINDSLPLWFYNFVDSVSMDRSGFFTRLGPVYLNDRYIGYNRPVLHITRMPCTVKEFATYYITCTDGKTIGHHKPGRCPFMVKEDKDAKDD